MRPRRPSLYLRGLLRFRSLRTLLSKEDGAKSWGVSAHWERYCGQDHEYVKAPIEGWMGIKNGIVRIGEEKIAFKHWLTDVERKWQVWRIEE